MGLRRLAGRLLAPVFLGLAVALPAQAGIFSVSADDLQAQARAAGAEGRALAIFLTLPDCPGCREMERDVFTSPALQRTVATRFRTLRLDVTGDAALVAPDGQRTTPAEFARRLRAVATPSFAFFDANGQVRYRYTGTLDEEGFAALTRFVERGDYERRPFAVPARKVRALFAAPPVATLPHQPAFRLQATDGRLLSTADFRGRVVALSVGYTACPDVCPTTLAELKHAVEALPADRRTRVQVLFATLDPERDSLQILRAYADAFRPRQGLPVLGLRGDPAQTAALVREFQLVADRQPSASMGYTLDHTAGVFLIDGSGRLRGLSPHGQPVEKLAADLERLTRTP